MADNVGLLLQLILDKAKSAEVDAGLKKTAKNVDDLEKSVSHATDSLGDDFQKFSEKFNKSFKLMEGNLVDIKTGAKVSADELRKFSKVNLDAEKSRAAAAEKSAQSIKEEKQEIKMLNRAISDMAKLSGLSEREIENLSDELFNTGRAALTAQAQIKKFDQQLAQTEKRVADLNQASLAINRISSGLFLTGSAIVGSIFLAANQEAQRIKEAGGVVDETTRKWLTAQQRIQLSYQRIGRVGMSAILPLLEKAAALAEKGSKFIERHPDLVRAALNTGLVIATVGAVGMLVAKGVRFFADVTLIAAQLKYAASTYMFKTSVDKFLAGVAGQKIAGGATATIGGAGALAQVAPAAGILLAGAFLVELERRGLNKIMGTDQSFGDIGESFKKYALLPLGSLLLLLEKTGPAGDKAAASIWNTVKAIYGLDDNMDELTDALDDLSASTEQAAADAEGMKIIIQLEKDNIEAERELASDRVDIINRMNDAIAKANIQLAQSISRIKATLADTLSNLSANFAKANQQAEIDYQTQRGDIIRDGNEEVLQIQRDAQEELRKLEEDFALQKDELTRSRDALGLVKAQREFDRQKSEIENNTDKEIQERRRQTQIQLADLRRSFERERAERLAKYQQDVIDAKARAAQEILEEQAAHAQRLQEIQRQKAEELAQLQMAYNEERRRRIIAAYEQIKDMGNAMNAERLLRSRYYSVILAETELWLQAQARLFRTSTSSGGAGAGLIPSRHSGGYTGDGLYNMKSREFVLAPATTAAAESLIGSHLSQQALLNTLAAGASGSLTLNDSRRFDSSIPLAERRAIEDEAAQKALRLFTSALKPRGRR